LITIESKTIYHAGDTDFIPEMREFENVDVALIPIGGTFTMDINDAVDATIAIKPKLVIPIIAPKLTQSSLKKKLNHDQMSWLWCWT